MIAKSTRSTPLRMLLSIAVLSICGIAITAAPAYAAAGDLDTAFDSDGKVTTQVGSGNSIANAIVYDGSKVIVAGRVGDTLTGDFGLARYNSDGSLDTSFGSSGIVITSFSTLSDVPRDIALQSDGKIIVGGLANSEPAGDFLLARYTSSGSLDTTFGTSSGYTRTDISGVGDGIRGLVIDGSDKIIAVGAAGPDSAIVRYTSGGSLDTTFESDGIVLTSSGVGDHFLNVAFDNNGKYVVAGTVDGDFLVSRYNTNGTLDTGFDGDGRAITGFATGESDLAMDIVVRGNGKIIAAGATGAVDIVGITTAKFALAGYNDNGSLDTGFDSDGKVTTDITTTVGASADGIRGAVLNSNSSLLVVAGYCAESHGLTSFLDPVIGDFCLARYDAGTGGLDTSFSGDGIVVTDFGGSGDGGRAIARRDSRVTVAGGAGGPLNLDFALARYEL